MESIQFFLVIAVIAMVLLGSLTRSLGGAFLGLAVVFISTGVYELNLGGWNILIALLMFALTAMSILLTAGLGINVSHSSIAHYRPDGGKSVASQTVLGEGAKQSYSRWGELSSSVQHQLSSGEKTNVP